MSPEELDAYMESIPEWKRGALVVTEQEKEQEAKKGLFGKLKSKASERFNETDFAKDFKQSEEYEKLK